MKKAFLVLIIILQSACASKLSKSVVILDYSDFGPQAMAYQTLGRKRLPWDPAAPVIIGHSQIRVVVYRDIPLQTVKENYPPDLTSNTDYRYLQYGEALNYLDAKIEQNLLRRITDRLNQARSTITERLGG